MLQIKWFSAKPPNEASALLPNLGPPGAGFFRLRLDHPDAWSVMKVTHLVEDDQTALQYRLLCGWLGGYARADEWRINSGIVAVILKNDIYAFIEKSGSTYHCDRRSYRMVSIMRDGIKRIERMRDVVSVEIMSDRQWQYIKFE